MNATSKQGFKPQPSQKKEHRGPKVRLRYVTSAVDLQGCPRDTKPEVALIGRSNAGKSTLLNGLGQERIAKVSSTPGKTRLLSFFDAGLHYRYVDMPGYGFSARSGGEQRSWQKMIEPYLSRRENLRGLLLILDVRREWTEDENLVLEFLRPRALPSAVILTKTDKVSRSQLLQQIEQIRRTSGVQDVFATSSLKHEGFHELEDFIYKNWIKA